MLRHVRLDASLWLITLVSPKRYATVSRVPSLIRSWTHVDTEGPCGRLDALVDGVRLPVSSIPRSQHRWISTLTT